MYKAVILMIEDNPDILRTNREQLELEGYRILEAESLAEGRQAADEEKPDLILLDILLPDGSGLEYCRELFGGNRPRILFLSALNTKQEVIAGLRAGGDDYITKPYLMEELLARVEALLRRDNRNTAADTSLSIDNLKICSTSRRVLLNGRDLLLRPMEFSLLEYLGHRPGRYVTSSELYEKLWGQNPLNDTDTVTVHMSKLRRKLGNDAPVRIESRWGKGYRLVRKS